MAMRRQTFLQAGALGMLGSVALAHPIGGARKMPFRMGGPPKDRPNILVIMSDEHAARVPMIVSWPRRWTGPPRRSEACSMVDLVQTIAELGGGPAPGDWNGDSMCGWMDDPEAGWKDRAVSEYYAHNIASGYAMLRTGECKYVYHTRMDETHGPERELYNLAADPGEFKNLASDPAQQKRVEKMHAQLVAELGEDPDETEQRCRADYARGYGRPERSKKKKSARKK